MTCNVFGGTLNPTLLYFYSTEKDVVGYGVIRNKMYGYWIGRANGELTNPGSPGKMAVKLWHACLLLMASFAMYGKPSGHN